MLVVLLRCAVLLRCVVLLRLRAPAALHGIIFFLHGRSLPLQLISPLASPLHCSSSRFESPPYLPHFPLLPRRSIMSCPAGGSMSASRFVHSPVAPTADPSNDMVGNFAFYTARCLQHTTTTPPSPPPPSHPALVFVWPLASVWRASSAACLQPPFSPPPPLASEDPDKCVGGGDKWHVPTNTAQRGSLGVGGALALMALDITRGGDTHILPLRTHPT